MLSVLRKFLAVLVSLPAVVLVMLAAGWGAAHFSTSLRDWVSFSYVAVPWLVGLALLVALLTAIARSGFGLFCALVAAAVFIAPFAPSFVLKSMRAPEEPGPSLRLRVMSFNVASYSNQAPGKRFDENDARGVARLIANAQPDIVLLQESSYYVLELITAQLAAIPSVQPYNIINPEDSELVVMSRFPMRTERAANSPLPVASVRVSTTAGDITIWVVHTIHEDVVITAGLRGLAIHPQNGRFVREQITWVAGQISGTIGPLIVAGDFNTPAGSPSLWPLADRLSEVHSVAGSGSGFTFPATQRFTRTVSLLGTTLPFSSPIKLTRIDHMFVSQHFVVAAATVGDDSAGSDHAPVFATLVLSGSVR
jgi:endonuclease/exonuclease/phosphatase (EEP) superfamily protein YafD